ncbi:MAG TPA: hypothetical protein VN457_06375, partial [Chlamydiales bacterium]|nr:hypothetical protein [Chlamydiales bacterium]
MNWILFNIVLLGLIFIDLNLHKGRTISAKAALKWSGAWICLAMIFNLGLYFFRGPDIALQFFTGYLLEYSLSVDNLFVFLTIFSYFQVSAKNQPKILFWGILGALVMRLAFILVGVQLIERFQWLLCVFGLFLIVTGTLMWRKKEEDQKSFDPNKNLILNLCKRWIPFDSQESN